MKNHGWVIKKIETGKYYGPDDGYTPSHSLGAAEKFATRSKARWVADPGEVVRKVSLTKNGKPKKIIGRG